jgi:hypothetical protein
MDLASNRTKTFRAAALAIAASLLGASIVQHAGVPIVTIEALGTCVFFVLVMQR